MNTNSLHTRSANATPLERGASQLADSWLAVCEALDQACPGWLTLAPVGRDAAREAILELGRNAAIGKSLMDTPLFGLVQRTPAAKMEPLIRESYLENGMFRVVLDPKMPPDEFQLIQGDTTWRGTIDSNGVIQGFEKMQGDLQFEVNLDDKGYVAGITTQATAAAIADSGKGHTIRTSAGARIAFDDAVRADNLLVAADKLRDAKERIAAIDAAIDNLQAERDALGKKRNAALDERDAAKEELHVAVHGKPAE